MESGCGGVAIPIYKYECDQCRKVGHRHTSVDNRDAEYSCQCGGVAIRVFTPTANINIPARFGLERGWHLPPKENKAAWSDMGAVADSSQRHGPDDKMGGYQKAMEQAVQGKPE